MQVQAVPAPDDDERRLARGVLAGDAKANKEFDDILRPRIGRIARLHRGRPTYEYDDRVDYALLHLKLGVRQNSDGWSLSSAPPVQRWLENPKGSFFRFCLVCARNFLVDVSRIGQIQTDPLPEGDADGGFDSPHAFVVQLQEEEFFDRELKRAVYDTYARLPPHDRKILVLKFHSDMTDAEIARSLSISETMARKRRHKALEKFKNLFVSKYGPIH
ncbi:MAG TPA: sigma-70 family RNA polymerase sigma factor [Pyrinomonadaceae bacterium]|nr:sigma-70 family RNA polymerase sigma factor [Pyrinomonadaceae bacterium]